MPEVTLLTLLIYVLIGGFIGLLLGPLLKRGGFGWFGNICLGALGAFLAGVGLTFSTHVVDNNLVMNALAAAAGAILLILIVAIFKRR
jgi:uncharacterized membrane protein YeaQ/YmgE (transglycosylase-associated protein family)